MKTIAGGWGPERKRAAVSITFDNMGEVAERRLGLTPIMGSGGSHLSIEVMPQLLRVLDHGPITYFVEGFNTEAYPDIIRSVRDAGHEIAAHGWEHENWASTPVSERTSAMGRAVEGFRAIGVDVQGFRPPGGKISLAELKPDCDANGLNYASPLGDLGDDENLGGFVSLPFAWEHVDAYVLHPELGALRKMFGDPEAPFSFEHWRNNVESGIEQARASGGHITLIFHPFVLGTDPRLIELLGWVARTTAQDPDFWTPTCREMAEWIRQENLFTLAA